MHVDDQGTWWQVVPSWRRKVWRLHEITQTQALILSQMQKKSNIYFITNVENEVHSNLNHSSFETSLDSSYSSFD